MSSIAPQHYICACLTSLLIWSHRPIISGGVCYDANKIEIEIIHMLFDKCVLNENSCVGVKKKYMHIHTPKPLQPQQKLTTPPLLQMGCWRLAAVKVVCDM